MKRPSKELIESFGRALGYAVKEKNVIQRLVTCPDCKGSGKRLWIDEKCQRCKGEGYTASYERDDGRVR